MDLKTWKRRAGILSSWCPSSYGLFDLRPSPPHLRFNYICSMDCQDIYPLLERRLLWGDSEGPLLSQLQSGGHEGNDQVEKEEDLTEIYIFRARQSERRRDEETKSENQIQEETERGRTWWQEKEDRKG